MMIGREGPSASQARVDDLRDAADWARQEAADRGVDTTEWIRAMSAAQMFESKADELQAELDALTRA